MDRRNFLGSVGAAVAAALAPGRALARLGFGRGIGHAGGIIPPASGFNYYISTTGSDANDGLTPATAWAITAINSKQATYAGKKVGLLDGTYSVYSLVNGGTYANAGLVINGSTSSASPTVIQAVNARKAILDAHQTPGTTGSGYPSGNAPILGPAQGDTVANPNNIVIDGLVLTGSSDFGISIHGKGSASDGGTLVTSGVFNGSYYGGPTGIVIQNCELYDITSVSFGDNPAAVNISFCTGAQVKNCVIHPMLSSTAAQVCGMLTFQCNGNVYENLTIYNSEIAIEEKEGPQGNTTVTGCYFESYSTSYGCLKDFSGGLPGWVTTIKNCILISGAPFENADALTESQVSQEQLIFSNCTFYNTSQFAAFGFLWKSWGNENTSPGSYPTSPAATEQFYNNIINCPGTGAGDAFYSNVTGLNGPIDYNCYRAATASSQTIEYKDPVSGTASYYTLSQWQAAVSFDAHSIASDPGFVSPTLVSAGGTPAGFQLQGTYGNSGTSACAGAGRVGGTSGGAACNMGAWDGTVTQIGANFTAGH